MKILSLLPAATEIVCALGLKKNLVGVTDVCDYPKGLENIPKVTECLSEGFLSSDKIDQKVKKLGHMGMSIAHLDEKKLEELKPDLILTQDLCQVCAVSYESVKIAARVLEGDVKIISLEPESVGDIIENILLVGEICNRKQESEILAKQLRERLATLKSKLATINSSNPKVLTIEWLDPLMVAGHWVPEMVEKAGGKMLLTKPAEKSRYISLQEIKKLKPDIVIIAPCGFNIRRTLKEKKLIDNLRNLFNEKIGTNPFIYLMDGNAYLTRPGPRIINGIEIMAEIIHPELFSKKHTKKDYLEYT